ncbi:aminotransferase class V-fold PLP-dependent enzyme [Phycicoccus endophyticus]|uniref:Aminotransferase class V-fold PLP-dependent enzyme n=1 Tax=Phycicoccus endophyticus TaxID=1690220 RepID=A0A7G9R594_9MICO|nr:aminotransferase class V-fold PLP-dependent enzyme [Phycicoccus endophyticus]NHI20622.1 aminotransferase class V-fold PLP-dependent enzyme [Phycicoccus endophyticus]QNN50769.1 aminotransferase class V-fold PLP-dependent enzyme [Phycicoccus endophyticus]GGL43181.1 cysteine desulfurase [Phycicoccus endophyticus]
MSTHHTTTTGHVPPTATLTRGPDAPGRALSPALLPATVLAPTVPLLDGRLVDYAQLDHAASTPALASVARAVASVTATYSSVHRGTGWLSRVTSAHYEAAREEVARFVGARPEDLVVFTRTTTDATNLLAGALPDATPVVVFDSEHHASLLPWDAERTHRLPVPHSPAQAVAALGDTLAGLADGPQPLVVVTGASNVTGELWPLEEIVGLARRHGARVLLDAAQLLAHRPVDLAGLGADWLVLSGHKLHAPFGAGALVGRADWLDAAPPYLAGGGASLAVTADEVTWATGAARHEGGSPNVVGAVALAAACAALREHRGAVEAHEAALTQRLLRGLRAVPGVRTLSLFGEDHERVPVVAFTVDGLDSHLVAAALSAEDGIGVRAGKFCAHRLVDTLLSRAGAGGDTAVRASAGLATTAEHVERLLTAVARLAAAGPAGEYRLREGAGWEPSVDPRTLEAALPW